MELQQPTVTNISAAKHKTWDIVHKHRTSYKGHTRSPVWVFCSLSRTTLATVQLFHCIPHSLGTQEEVIVELISNNK